MELTHSSIKKAIIRSQHCQRNYDLSKQVDQEDLDTILFAATNCPSKQNIRFYKLHVITDRNIIEQIHEFSTGAGAFDEFGKYHETTNSQVLANVVLVYEILDPEQMTNKANYKWTNHDDASRDVYRRDADTAIGIASGYVNLTASLLGYSTGCCQCFQHENIKKLLGIDNIISMIQGLGFKDPTRNRRYHHSNNLKFRTRRKEEIDVDIR